jgi:hypothetical protein
MNSKKIEEQRFEFVLTINGGNIVCQRYFHIRDYNEKSVYSREIRELMDNIVGMNNGGYGGFGIIPKHLKKKAINYLWDNYNPYQDQTEVIQKNNFEKEDIFTFEIKVDKQTVASQSFIGNYFPPKIRYQVDIKEIIPAIMAEIRYFLSLKKYSSELAY